MRSSSVKAIALGGVLAAMAVVMLCISGLIPVFTYAAPILCMVISAFVIKLCGARIAWAWYVAVGSLGLLLCADKEAAMIYAVLGYYPLIKPQLDKIKFSLLLKLLIFNGTTLTLYCLLLNLLGLQELAQELKALGTVMTILFFFLGNTVFLLVDHVLGKAFKKNLKKSGGKGFDL